MSKSFYVTKHFFKLLSIVHLSFIFKTTVFHVSNNVKIHFKHSGVQGNDIILLSRNTRPTASYVCQQWRVAAFVDIAWNMEASSKLHNTVCFLSMLAPI